MINDLKTSRPSAKYPMYFIDQFLSKPTLESVTIHNTENYNNVTQTLSNNDIEFFQALNANGNRISYNRATSKIKSKALSLVNEPKKQSSKNTYKINFFSPQNPKIKKLNTFSERSNKYLKTTSDAMGLKSIKKTKLIKNSYLLSRENIEKLEKTTDKVENNPKNLKTSNILFKSIKKTFEAPKKNSEAKPKIKFINMQYNTAKSKAAKEIKDIKEITLIKEKTKESFKQIRKTPITNIISSREISMESRKFLLKRNSENNCASNSNLREDKLNKFSNVLNTNSSKTCDGPISDSYLLTVNKTDCLNYGFINNKYKGLIDQFLNETKEKIYQIYVEDVEE